MITANEQHNNFKNDLLKLIGNHPNMTMPEMLAISAQVVGMILACQDSGVMTAEIGMEIVEKNIETGNMVAIEGIIKDAGGRI